MVKVKQVLIGLLLALVVTPMGFQLWQIWNFQQQGARFTAQDGQQLCERVADLERRSYGYRDAGKMPLTCDYLERQ